jgi:hypothetical protein
MARKKSDASRRVKQVFTPTRANPKKFEGTEEGEGREEKFNYRLNQAGLNPTLDRIASPSPTGKGKEPAAKSATFSFPGTSTTIEN